MTTTEVQSGLEGVVAFATEIAEPDKEGGALRYRGVDIEDLVGSVPYEKVWGLLVDGSFEPGPAARRAARADGALRRPARRRAGGARDARSRVGDAAAARHQRRAGAPGSRALLGDGAELRRAVRARPRVARGSRSPRSTRERRSPSASCYRWRGEAHPDHARAIDAYWISAAEHGMNASTFTARVVASTGADVAAALSSAVGALSGPLHGGAPSRVLQMLDEVEECGDADAWVKDALDRGDRLMGFGHRVYRAEDPRARVLRRTAKELGSTRYAVAEALEVAALAELQGAQARPRARDERRVLVGRRARHGRGPRRALHEHVHLRARRRLVGAHPRAEARGAADPPDGEVRRAGAAAGRGGGRGVGPGGPAPGP